MFKSLPKIYIQKKYIGSVLLEFEVLNEGSDWFKIYTLVYSIILDIVRIEDQYLMCTLKL